MSLTGRKQVQEDRHAGLTQVLEVPHGEKEEIVPRVCDWVQEQMDKDRKIGALKGTKTTY
jgi:hypothetical protein